MTAPVERTAEELPSGWWWLQDSAGHWYASSVEGSVTAVDSHVVTRDVGTWHEVAPIAVVLAVISRNGGAK